MTFPSWGTCQYAGARYGPVQSRGDLGLIQRSPLTPGSMTDTTENLPANLLASGKKKKTTCSL